MIRFAAIILAGGLLTACASVETPGEDWIDEPVAGCDAEALKYLLGQSITEIDVDSLPSPRRVIPHGTAVTMDYREGRYNFELDEARRVSRIYCG